MGWVGCVGTFLCRQCPKSRTLMFEAKSSDKDLLMIDVLEGFRDFNREK